MSGLLKAVRSSLFGLAVVIFHAPDDRCDLAPGEGVAGLIGAGAVGEIALTIPAALSACTYIRCIRKGFTLDRSEVDSFMAFAATCATARRVMGASDPRCR